MRTRALGVGGWLAAALLVAGGVGGTAQPEPVAIVKPAALQMGADDVLVYYHFATAQDALIMVWGDGLYVTVSWDREHRALCRRGNIEAKAVQGWLDEAAALRSHDGELYAVPDGPEGMFYVRIGGKRALKVCWDEVIVPCWGSNVSPKKTYIECAGAWMEAKVRLVGKLRCDAKEFDITKDTEIQARTGYKTVEDFKVRAWR